MRLFDDLMTWQPPGSEVVWSALPSPISLDQNEHGATITVDMPGVDPQDVDLTFEEDTLTIAGKRGEQMYRFSVVLGNTIEPDSIEARLDKGVLTVCAHKRPEARPRKIVISTAEKSHETSEATRPGLAASTDGGPPG
jgi:HSP20 family protein